MKRTNQNNTRCVNENEQLLVDTKTLRKILNCGHATAIKIGEQANARIKIGKRVLWSKKAIKDFIENQTARQE